MTKRIWLGAGGGILALVLMASLFSGAVFAQDGEDDTSIGQAFIERLAGKLGITTDELQSAVKDTQTEMVDEAVANGRITERQAETMKQRIETGEGRFGFGKNRDHGMRGGHFMLGRGLLTGSAIADELGLTNGELRQQIAAGATLTEVIEANGKTVDEIVAALVERAATKLDAAVANGRITQQQADALLAEMPERLTERIESGLFGPLHFELDLDTEAEETSDTL